MAETNEPPIAKALPVLDYAPTGAVDLVKLESYPNEAAARMAAGELEEEGILVNVLGANTAGLGLYQTFAQVELYVRKADLELAKWVLLAQDDEFLEPAENATPATTPPEPVKQLVPAGSFENLNEMRNAALVLRSARVRYELPKLVHRGDRPPGSGKRFILCVSRSDLVRARRVLDADEIENRNQPRCPNCHAWNVGPISSVWRDLGEALHLLPKSSQQFECFKCRHVDAESAFRCHK